MPVVLRRWTQPRLSLDGWILPNVLETNRIGTLLPAEPGGLCSQAQFGKRSGAATPNGMGGKAAINRYGMREMDWVALRFNNRDRMVHHYGSSDP